MNRVSKSTSKEAFEALREHLGLNITQFARLLEVHPSQVSHWELGDTKPNKSNIENINRTIGVLETMISLDPTITISNNSLVNGVR